MRSRAWAAAAGAAAAITMAVAARLAYGPGSVGFDGAWALVWGDQVAHGRVPEFEDGLMPTPHPLANLAGAVLAPLGAAGAAQALVALSWLAFGALAWGLVRLGSELFAWPVGALAAALVATRSLLVDETVQTLIDIPFLAALVWAGVLELRARRGAAWLLLAAGLLRPEGWLAGAAYVAYRRRARGAAIVAAGPLMWAAMDLWATGDPLHSLHGTQDLAESTGRPRSIGTALEAAPDYLAGILREPLVWVCFAGAAAGLMWQYRASLLPGAVVVAGLLAFAVLGVAGLPLLARYLLPVAVALALFGAVAVLGWTAVEARRRLWLAGGALAAGVVAAGIPGDVDALRSSHAFAVRRHALQQELADAARLPALRAAARRCGRVIVPDPRPRPLLELALGRPVTVRGDGRPALVFAYANPIAARDFALTGPAAHGLPPGARRLYGGAAWLVGVLRC